MTETATPSTAVEVHDPPAPSAVARVERTEWEVICSQADVLSRARGVVPMAYIGKPENIIAAALYGRSVGFDVPTSLRTIHVVEGKPSFSADALCALVRGRGHSLSGEISPEQATARGRRGDTGDEMTVTWTMEMARTADLAHKANWKKYPQSMLWARAVSQLCRMLFADVTLGMAYTPEELAPDVAVDDRGNVIEGTIVERAPEPRETVIDVQTRDAQMRAWATSLTVDRKARWEAWKDAHEGWQRDGEKVVAAWELLRDLAIDEATAAEREPFGDVDGTVIDAEIVHDEEPPATADDEGAAGPQPAGETQQGNPDRDRATGGRPAAEDDGPAPFMSNGQSKHLHGELRKLRPPIVGSARHTWASTALGREITTFKDVTYAEAEFLIELAERSVVDVEPDDGGAA